MPSRYIKLSKDNASPRPLSSTFSTLDGKSKQFSLLARDTTPANFLRNQRPSSLLFSLSPSLLVLISYYKKSLL